MNFFFKIRGLNGVFLNKLCRGDSAKSVQSTKSYNNRIISIDYIAIELIILFGN